MVHQKDQPESGGTEVEPISFVNGIKSFQQNIQSDGLVDPIFEAVEVNTTLDPTDERPQDPASDTNANTSRKALPNASVKETNVDREQDYARRNPFGGELDAVTFPLHYGRACRRKIGILVDVRLHTGSMLVDFFGHDVCNCNTRDSSQTQTRKIQSS